MSRPVLAASLVLILCSGCVVTGRGRAVASGESTSEPRERPERPHPHRPAKPAVVEAEKPEPKLAVAQTLLWALLAKSEASDGYVFTAADCVQLHGGVGFTWEFDPHIHLKRARLNEMLLAQNRIVRDLAADRLAAATRAGRGTLELPTA